MAVDKSNPPTPPPREFNKAASVFNKTATEASTRHKKDMLEMKETVAYASRDLRKRKGYRDQRARTAGKR